MTSRIFSTLLAVLLLAGSAVPVLAQQRDTTKTPAERIRERLRAIAPLITDTTTQDSLPGDSAAVDSLDTTDVEFVDSIPTGPPSDGLTGIARDSVTEQLLRLPGYVPTEYKAEEARFVADSARLDLSRAAEVLREGMRLTADTSIIFYQDSAYACAYGQPVVSGASLGSPVSSDSLCYDIDRGIGIARGARTQVDESGTWFVTGRELVTIGEDVYTHDAVFTDCDLEQPHYHFGAANMKVVRDNVLVARDVTLRFGDVPVLWLPFFVQSLASGRRSGLLTPRVSINDVAPTSNSYARQVDNLGFYWAISDHLG
ncbi:MAG: putative LPS assembly protein LptD, partial [Longimicrobiales bacterium]